MTRSDKAGTARPSESKSLPEAVHRQLERLLESVHFCASKRARYCLQYIVDRTIEGSTDRLKERCVLTV